MNKRSWLGIMTGVAFGSLAVAGWRLYGRRSTRTSSQPGGHRRSGRGAGLRPDHAASAHGAAAELRGAPRDEPGRRRRRGRSRLRTGLSGRRARAPCARTPRDGRGFVGCHADPGDRQRPAGRRGASDRLPHRRRRRAAFPRCFPGPGGEHPVAASLGRPQAPSSTKSPASCGPAAHSCSSICAATWGPRPGCCCWFATHVVVPPALRHIGEPLGSRNAAYTPDEAAGLLQTSRLTGWRVARGLFWLSIEGYTV